MNRKRSRSEISNNELMQRNRERKVEGIIFEETQSFQESLNLEPSSMLPDFSSNDPKSSIVHRKIADLELLEVATPFTGSNGNNGVMFDVSTRTGSNKVIEIVSLDVHTNIIGDDCPIIVYGRKGTHFGFENSTESWTLLANTTTQCNGFGARTHVPPFITPPTLNSGETYGFYTHMPTASLRYVNGFEVGNIYESDGFFNIHEGTGVTGEFGTANTKFLQPRKWDGVIKYQIVSEIESDESSETCNDMLTTSYVDNIGSYGNMFDIESGDFNLDVYGVDFYTDINEAVTYEIFSRDDSYTNGMGPLEPSAIKNLGPNPSNIAKMELLGWTLVKTGTTTGRGYGKGTPVRGFSPFRVPPRSTQGFYVTLNTPDIRYRDITADLPNAVAGDLFVNNEDLSIHLGMSVGSYPSHDSFFGPRLWSGSIIYTTDHTCATESPSLSPSSAPSITVTSTSPSATPTKDIPPLGNCTNTAWLETPLDGGTGSYGNMFTITAQERISITSMDINVGTSNQVYVEVYTKPGSYKGYEDRPNAWTRVAAVNLVGADDGNPTVIDDVDFEDIHMRSGQLQSIYVTLDSPDIKYSRTYSGVGAVFREDNMLTINVGAGLAAPGFNGGMFEPRVFNGIVHYKHKDDCAYETSSFVFYSFNIYHDAGYTDMDELVKTVNETVENTMRVLIQITPTLREYTSEHDFAFAAAKTTLTDSGCRAAQSELACTSVTTQVTFSHMSSLDRGTVTFILLEYKDDISNNLNKLDIFEADYVGEIPVQSVVVVELEGDFNQKLSVGEQEYFETITRAFLNDQLSQREIKILNVVVEDQKLQNRRLQRTDDDEGPSRGSIDISTLVDGSYTPPPNIDFSGVIEDALNADDGTAYQEDLVNGRRDMPEDLRDEMAAFQNVLAVETKSELPSTNVDAASDTSGSPVVPILVGSLCGLLVLFVLVVFCTLRRKKANKGTDLVNMEALDMNSAFFGDFFSKKQASAKKLSSRNLFFDAECTYAEEDEDLHMSHGGVPMQMMEDDYAPGAANSVGSANARSYRSPNGSFSQLNGVESRSPNASFSQLHGMDVSPAFMDQRVSQSMRHDPSTSVEELHRSAVSLGALQQYGSGRSNRSGGSGSNRSLNRSPGRSRSPIPIEQANSFNASGNSISFHESAQSSYHNRAPANRYHQSAPVNLHASANSFHDSGNSNSRWSR
mmetsp:Transcript_2534/g.3863  ORF Transcript_2534/g.3863 Transcript_2534/m.3863 type:complete len:1190 (+) Transcript_2534:56-3625(+)